MKLLDGSRVAIVGGGPAGSLFALYLLHYAGQAGIHPDITIYQERPFDRPGPRGCKGCAGILSTSLLENLKELGLTLPPEIIQGNIDFYAVHSPYVSISISNPDKGASIASIYRGSGPRHGHGEHLAGFDAWLLARAQERGAHVQSSRVSAVHLESGPEVEVAGRRRAYDLIVLATGVNTRPIPVTGPGYVPPRVRTMAQEELYAGTEQVQKRLGGTAHAFLVPHSKLIFGTLVPKGPFVNVSVLSSGEPPVSVADFLKLDVVREILPERYEHACRCQPRAVVGPARNYYGDGFVAIGDAAVSRLYKDGIGSSLLTARQAARTVAQHGMTRRDFHRHYRPFCNRINRDNRWGRLLFAINDRTKDSRAFVLAQQRLIGDEQSGMRDPRPFTSVVWGMFTGSYSYGRMARMAFGPLVLLKLSLAIAAEALAGLLRRGATARRRVHIGSRKVLILGSGFGGTFALRQLVPHLNRNENVETTMVSDENFFLFSPLLHEVAMGSIETRHVAYPIRRLHWRDRFNFVQASVQKIDLEGRRVVTSAGTLEYDYLVMALGSVANLSQLHSEGADSQVFSLKTLHDSILIRNHIIGMFEQASAETSPERQRQLLTFVVSGGGYIGIQVVAELHDLIYKNLTNLYRSIDPGSIRLMLIEAEPRIVPRLHPKLVAHASRYLERMGIEVRTGSRVTRARDGFLEINGQEQLPASTLIWVAGVVANPLVAQVSAETDSIGRVVVNQYLEVPEYPGVYAVGDCAHFIDPASGRPIPPRAHTTVRQARIAARNILADIRGREKKPYRYSRPVEIISLGASKALFQYRGLRLHGFPARLIWLVSYAYLVTGVYNRVRVLTDWLLSLVFGRDSTFLRQIR